LESGQPKPNEAEEPPAITQPEWSEPIRASDASGEVDARFDEDDLIDEDKADNMSALSIEDAHERARLLDAMEKTGWVQAKAARVMGLTPRQIGYALRKHGIEIKKF